MTQFFTNPSMLWFLTAIPLLYILLIFAAYKRRKAMAALLNHLNAKHLIDPRKNSLRRFSEICLLIACIFMILALARPAWDTQQVPQPRLGRDLIFMLDISQSMLAEDQPPNRLEYAKNAISQCLEKIRSGRVGLVAFAGATTIKCPLTKDFEFFRSVLTQLAPDSVPVGGTRIGDAINKTVDKILGDKESGNYDIIVITDGESHTPLNTNAISRMAASKANLIIVGIGSDSVPASIPIYNEETLIKEPLTSNGNIVYTLQNSSRLRQISELIPKSIYINAGTNPLNLADIYRTHTTLAIPSTKSSELTEQPIEQYWRFLLVAIVCIIASYLPRHHNAKVETHLLIVTIPVVLGVLAQSASFSENEKCTRRATPDALGRGRPTLQPKFINTAKIFSIIIMLILSSATTTHAKNRTKLFDAGISAYKSENFDDAIKQFSAAEQKKANPVISFNLGTAYYRQGDMSQALLHFTHATEETDNESLAINAMYNSGNSYFMMAVHAPPQTTTLTITGNIQNAINAYLSVIMLKPEHADATFNLKAARSFLEQMATSNNENGDEGESDSNSEEESEDNSSSDSNKSSSDTTNQEAEEEMSPPNLTPDDIIKEENKNSLNRSRKKHADFGKVEMNW